MRPGTGEGGSPCNVNTIWLGIGVCFLKFTTSFRAQEVHLNPILAIGDNFSCKIA